MPDLTYEDTKKKYDRFNELGDKLYPSRKKYDALNREIRSTSDEAKRSCESLLQRYEDSTIVPMPTNTMLIRAWLEGRYDTPWDEGYSTFFFSDEDLLD